MLLSHYSSGRHMNITRYTENTRKATMGRIQEHRETDIFGGDCFTILTAYLVLRACSHQPDYSNTREYQRFRGRFHSAFEFVLAAHFI